MFIPYPKYLLNHCRVPQLFCCCSRNSAKRFVCEWMDWSICFTVSCTAHTLPKGACACFMVMLVCGRIGNSTWLVLRGYYFIVCNAVRIFEFSVGCTSGKQCGQDLCHWLISAYVLYFQARMPSCSWRSPLAIRYTTAMNGYATANDRQHHSNVGGKVISSFTGEKHLNCLHTDNLCKTHFPTFITVNTGINSHLYVLA